MNAPSQPPPYGTFRGPAFDPARAAEPARIRPHAAWYTAPAVLLAAGLCSASIGLLLGLVLVGGKHYVCDATTSCAKSPYEAGYQDPAMPHAPFVIAGLCAAVALATFAGIFLARRRAATELKATQTDSPWRNHSPRR